MLFNPPLLAQSNQQDLKIRAAVQCFRLSPAISVTPACPNCSYINVTAVHPTDVAANRPGSDLVLRNETNFVMLLQSKKIKMRKKMKWNYLHNRLHILNVFIHVAMLLFEGCINSLMAPDN